MLISHLFPAIAPIRGRVSFLVCGASLAFADVVAWLGAYQIVAPLSYLAATKYVIMAAAWCVWSAFVRKQYTRRHSFWTEFGLIFQGVLMLAFVGSMLKALLGNTDSMLTWLVCCIVLAVELPLFRCVARWGLRKGGLWACPTLVFGGAENARQAVLVLRGEDDMGYVVAGMVLPHGVSANAGVLALNIPLSVWPEKKEDFVILRGYHCVIALEAHDFELRDQLIRLLSQYGVGNVHVIPSMRGVPLFELETTQFFSNEVLMIHVQNSLMNPLHRYVKRIFDIVGAICLIVVSSPLMLWVAYKIWRSDGSPVIFSQPRLGKNLKIFNFYKFRSMVQNAESMLMHWEATNSCQWQEYTSNNFKLVDDPRLISIGGFIRRTSIDELPQLFNVLKGEMSLVGPRPLLPREQIDYGNDISHYAQTPPGLTGLWQVSGRSETTFEDRVNFDTWYVKNWSLLIDITILFKTWSVVFRRRGAY